MNRSWAVLILLASFAPYAAAQAPAKPGPASPAPAGTQVTEHQTDTLVQPQPKAVAVTPRVVRQAQTELNDRGYKAGPADGIYGPATHAAIARFQADQGLPQTGRLDLDTMSKLNIGGAQALVAAPADVGRGGKAFGHNIKEGHPVAAGKALGTGAVSSGKKVAKGATSLGKQGVEKVGSALSKIGGKVEDKAQGEDKKNPPPQSGQNPPPR